MPFAEDQADLRSEVRRNEAILRELPLDTDDATGRERGIALWKLGEALLRLDHREEAGHRFAEAAETLSSVPSVRGMAVFAQIRQASVSMLIGNYDEAIAVANKAISAEGPLPMPANMNLDDFLVLGYLTKMVSLEALDRLEEADATAAALISRFEGAHTPAQRGAVAEAFLHRGRFAHEQGDPNDALDKIDEAISRSAGGDDKKAVRVHAAALVARGTVLSEVERIDEARSSFEEAASARFSESEDRFVQKAVKEALDHAARLSPDQEGVHPGTSDMEIQEHLVRAHHALADGDLDTAISVGDFALELCAGLRDRVLIRDCSSQMLTHARMLLQFQSGSSVLRLSSIKAVLFLRVWLGHVASKLDTAPRLRRSVGWTIVLVGRALNAVPPTRNFASAAAVQRCRNIQAEKVTGQVIAALQGDSDPEAQKLLAQAQLLHFEAQTLVTGRMEFDALERVSAATGGDFGFTREAEILRETRRPWNVASGASLEFLRTMLPFENVNQGAYVDELRWFVERHEHESNWAVRAYVASARLTIWFEGSRLKRTFANVRGHTK